MNLDDISQNPVQTPQDPIIPEPKAQMMPESTAPVTPPVVTPPQEGINKDAHADININVSGSAETKKNEKKTHGFFRILSLLALIVVGFLMLGETTGILKLNLQGFEINIIYPIVVLLSVIILFLYKKIIGKLLGLIVFLIIVGGLGTISIYHSLVPGGPSKFDESLVFMLDDGNQAALTINTYIGDYVIAGKDFSVDVLSGNNKLILDGKYQSDRALLVDTGFTNDNIAYLKLNESNNRNVVQDIYSNLNVYLSDTTNFDLYFKNFLGKYIVDLVNVPWKGLTIHGGVGSLDLAIGDKFENNAELEIKSARSKINLKIPKNVGVRLYYKQLAGSIELQNFQKIENQKNYYESLNLANAKKIINISVQVGVGKFVSERVD